MMRWLSFLLMLMVSGCAQPAAMPSAADLQALPVIGGVLAADTLLDGDYLLQGDLLVPAGVTLTIKPGSTLYIQSTDSTKIDPEFLSKETEILVRGRLLAIGSQQEPIRFLPLPRKDVDILWSGLQLVESEGSRLEYLRIEQAEAGVLCLNSSPALHAVQISGCRYGVLLQQDSSPRITDSLIADGEAGLFCWDRSAPQLRNSVIRDQQEEGLYLGRDCQPQLENNLLTENDRGVVLPRIDLLAPSNRLVNNRLDRVLYDQGEGQ